MAGKELYIEPILDANLSVVPKLSENIAEMTAQLNETTRILINMLSNQGLELHQEAYNGSAFSGLTLTQGSSGPGAAVDGEMATLYFTYPKKGNAFQSSSHIYQDFQGNTPTVKVTGLGLDLNDCDLLKIKIRCYLGVSFTTVNVTLYFRDGTSSTINANEGNFTGPGEQEYTFNITESEKIIDAYVFEINNTAGTDIGFEVREPQKRRTDGTFEDIDIVALPKIKFNAANALAYDVIGGMNNRAWPYSVYISLPDIPDVGSWATFLVNGNIEGASLSIVDDTTRETLLVLPAATSDITQLVQTSNLALKVEFASLTNVINSIAQRCYSRRD